jgi:hypothetical protein
MGFKPKGLKIDFNLLGRSKFLEPQFRVHVKITPQVNEFWFQVNDPALYTIR